MLPLSQQLQPEFAPNSPISWILDIFLAAILNLNDFRVALILMPTQESDPVEKHRSILQIPHIDDASGRYLIR
jgi:hypothetical protein